VFERFTDRSRRVLVLAQEEARLLGHSSIGTEHVFLGLLSEGAGAAARALASSGVELEPARAELEELLGGQARSGARSSPPFTPRAKKVLERSLREALAHDARSIDTGHLLLGLLDVEADGPGTVTALLGELGTDPADVRRRAEDALAGLDPGVPGRPPRVGRAIERFFEHLTARDWDVLGEVLSPDVQRVGPFGDGVDGRERYLDLLAGVVPEDYANDVHRVTYARDRRSGFARVTEHLAYPGREPMHLEEAYAFGLDGEGRIERVEIFWQSPEADPGGFGSATSEESYGEPSPGAPDEDPGRR
jgi:ClpA/ClpB-like protein/SnoaL-like protein